MKLAIEKFWNRCDRLYQHRLGGLLLQRSFTHLLWVHFIFIIFLVGYILGSFKAPPLTLILQLTGGFFIYTLYEYMAHRFSFHHTPFTLPWLKKSSGRVMHLAHHQEQDRILIAGPILYGLFWLFTFAIYFIFCFNLEIALAFTAGHLMGYAFHIWVHWGMHEKRNHRYLLWMRRYHFHHHQKNPLVNFGVSSPLWDWVFNTFETP